MRPLACALDDKQQRRPSLQRYDSASPGSAEPATGSQEPSCAPAAPPRGGLAGSLRTYGNPSDRALTRPRERLLVTLDPDHRTVGAD
jgi:hypothetical protein